MKSLLSFLLFAATAYAMHASAAITVTDYLGRSVTLSKPAKRVIALAPKISVESVISRNPEVIIVSGMAGRELGLKRRL